jgi:RNA polymerase sigma-70 factor (ECF subfamily)
MKRWEERDDATLLSATASEPEAFGAFYRRHLPALLAYCRRRTGSAELAFDLTAEVFAAALTGSARYRAERESAAPWLLGIARHKLAESARRGQIEDRARRRLGMEAIELTDEGVASLEGSDLLGALPADQRDAVQARIVDERDYSEIAAELRCSEQVVRKRVSRGLERLRTQMEGER